MIDSSDICIILTTTIHTQNYKISLAQRDKQERLECYLKAVRLWIENTNFRLVLVENTGYLWPELNQYVEQYSGRFKICSFNEELEEDAKYLKGDQSKGTSEMFAIDFAYRNVPFVKSSKYILKITGRYYIPELEKYLQSHPLERYGAIRQKCPDRCELLGCRSDFFNVVFYKKSLDRNGHRQGHVENVYKYRIESITKQYHLPVLICKEFRIESTRRGGNHDYYNNI